MSLQVLPFYLVCDESGSMAGVPIESINTAMKDLRNEIGSIPVVADKTRFCLIGFSDQAEILLELSDISTVTSVPALQASGGTNYAAAFTTLRKAIGDDVERLKKEGHQVFRPAVFFLSDGQPNPGTPWQGEFAMLTDPTWSANPNLLAFGFGAADEAVIRQVGRERAFIADNSLSPAAALSEFAQSLVRSIVNSGTQSAADPSGGATLAMPDQVPGFTTITAPLV
ncbi:MAG TPA: VWA domain-containing protein [Actinospica sp.]|jgi:uncharacterized protein YegL|nr:VWA domain-containing protein [Actinospica sp.]